MTNPTAELQLAKELMDNAQNGKLEQIDAIWVERIKELPAQSGFYKEWLRLMVRAKAKERAEELVATVVEDRIEGNKWNAAMRILAGSISYFPQSERLRKALLTAIEGFYGNIAERKELLALSGLEGDIQLAEGFRVFREWAQMTPGQVYQHYDWGEGIVRELDIADRSVVIDFPKAPAKRMKVDGVKKFLRHLEARHFLARRAREPETLLAMADKAPASLIKLVLEGAENKELKQSDVKAQLTPGLIPAESWNSWWSRAREALKLDPYVDFEASGGARALIRLRVKARTLEDEIKEEFFSREATIATQSEIIRQLTRHPKASEVPGALIEKMNRRLHESWRLIGAEHPVALLEIAYMLADLHAVAPDAAVETIDQTPLIAAIIDYGPLVEIDNVDYGIKAVTALLERDGDAGCEKAARLLPTAPIKLAQSIWKALGAEHADFAVRAIEELLASPLDNPDTYVWAIRSMLDGAWEHLEDYFPAAAIVPEILNNLETWDTIARSSDKGQAAVARSLLTRARALLSGERFTPIARAVEGMNRDTANRLRHKLQSNNALPSTFKTGAERAILLVRRDLDDGSGSLGGITGAGASATSTTSVVDDTHLCTTRSYHAKMLELRDISSVRIPQNAKVIEDARKEGDLRENAGYQYAKEEQKMLMQQKVTLSEQLGNAVIFKTENVDTERVGFGTTFRVKNLDNSQEETYTVMGRWEADPEHNILSLHAPLAQQFLGRRPGESLTIQRPDGDTIRYEVLSIENAMLAGGWDHPASQDVSTADS